MNKFTKTTKSWQWPQLPEELAKVVKISEIERLTIDKLGNLIEQELAKRDKEEKVSLELITLSWLYDLVRTNIKRGRNFIVDRALTEKKADCLAYGQILETLARRFGLNVGIIEVIIDNGGRYASHPCNLLKLSDGSWRLVDLWYGSKNINHRRIGAWVKEKMRWIFQDLNEDEFSEIEDINGLSEKQIRGLAYYTFGNIAFNRENWDEAIDYYQRAKECFPENARIYHNLALAYEKKLKLDQAERNFGEAFQKDPGGLRLLAEEHEEIEKLIELDESEMNEEEQRRYLLEKGFI